MGRYIAVDLGATSGRIALVDTSSGTFDVNIVHRFLHEATRNPEGFLVWDWDRIVEQSIVGIRAAAELGPVTSIGVDSWAVDYGFLGASGELLPPVVSYRDSRTADIFDSVIESVGKDRIYETTGIQFLPLNTLYQLVSSKNDANYLTASKFLLLPDLLNNLLTGSISTEITNASTTQLLDGRKRTWDFDLIDRLGLRREIFPQLHEPGTSLGKVRGFDYLDGIEVVAVGSHDTASAVAGAPLADNSSEAYLSSGTWSLLGIESISPSTSPAALEANITNELGVEGTVRTLKNITGLWILEECRRAWKVHGIDIEMPELVAMAEDSSDILSTFDPNDPIFAAPGDMPGKITAYLEDHDERTPKTLGEFARVIFTSLAIAYKRALEELEQVTGRSIATINVLGGGSQIELLNRLTADVTGREVIVGPTEATLFGNVIVQAIAAGEFANLSEARAVLRASLERRRFLPEKGALKS